MRVLIYSIFFYYFILLCTLTWVNIITLIHFLHEQSFYIVNDRLFFRERLFFDKIRNDYANNSNNSNNSSL